jgi:hypothetical protein
MFYQYRKHVKEPKEGAQKDRTDHTPNARPTTYKSHKLHISKPKPLKLSDFFVVKVYKQKRQSTRQYPQKTLIEAKVLPKDGDNHTKDCSTQHPGLWEVKGIPIYQAKHQQ